MKHILKHAFFPALIIFITAFISVLNYTSGTFLTGWDTLHPEFNFPLAFYRIFNGVWRVDQGLGTIAIHSHMADLPRVTILWILSQFIRLSDVRYITTFLPLLLGPLGVYFLASHVYLESKIKKGVSFLAALAYLCNMGTVGQFIVPFEMFSFQYAFLPWVLLYALQFLQKGSKKTLLVFILFSILIIPQAYAATLFYAFFIAFLASVAAFYFLFRSPSTLKRMLLLISTILILNSYWLLPNMYAARVQGKEVMDSQINRFFSPEAFAVNQMYGNPFDSALLRNFLFEWRIYDFNTQNSGIVASAWKTYLNNPLVEGFGYVVFIISLLGVIVSIKQKNKAALFLLPLSAIGFIALLNGTLPISLIFEKIGTYFPMLREALRFPFTKFSILWMLGLSIYFGLGISYILKLLRKQTIQFVAIFLFSCSFLWYFYPAFQGQLINPAVRITIPNEYFQLFSWTNTQPATARVAILPAHSFWNWVYYSWGYQGSGFLQFGIPQPLLDSDYNRWSKYNEQYQREMEYAVYNQNPKILEGVLQKYNIKYMILDTSIINISGFKNETLTWYIPTLLKQSKDIKLVKQFGKNIFVYEYTKTNVSSLETYKNVPDIGPSKTGMVEDKTYGKIGTYLTNKNIENDQEKKLTTYNGRYTGSLHSIIQYTVNPYSSLNPIEDCSNHAASYQRTIGVNAIRYTSVNGPLCDYFAFPNLPHDKSYIVEITSRNITGFPMKIYICNNLNFHCNQEYYLTPLHDSYVKEAFIIPSYDDHGEGYTININNYAIRNTTTINEIKEVSVRYYNPLSEPYKQTPAVTLGLHNAVYNSPWKSAYQVSSTTDTNTVLTYSQRYDPGWKAYITKGTPNFIQNMFPFFGKELKNHVLVNNWANGWVLGEPVVTGQITGVTIVFLPQYLEYMGFLFAGVYGSVLGVIILKKRLRRAN